MVELAYFGLVLNLSFILLVFAFVEFFFLVVEMLLVLAHVLLYRIHFFLELRVAHFFVLELLFERNSISLILDLDM